MELVWFTKGAEKKFFEQSYIRSGKYRPLIVSKLKEAGLPEELSWLPLIESGFKVKALSKARALGLWQFIPSTGYKFGLKRNQYIDERIDPEKSTDSWGKGILIRRPDDTEWINADSTEAKKLIASFHLPDNRGKVPQPVLADN